MTKVNKEFFAFLIIALMTISSAWAQTTISGKIMDGDFDEPLIGVNIAIKGKTIGTTTDFDGNFTLVTTEPTPFTLVFSYIGYEQEEVEVTGSQVVNLTMGSQAIMADEVVVSASRVEERILESPVTIEKLDPTGIKQAATADYYDAIANLKGVQATSGSLTFTAINTRGFNSISNTRFVQLMDGMDNAAPLLNFPTGNIVGISELDVHSVELIPGAASALYGANAFNGILLMNSKNPFDYQGFSVQAKAGGTFTDDDRNPYGSVAARYANAFGKKKKVAIKANVSYLGTTDWEANDYTTGRATDASTNVSEFGALGFDGLNSYGDEAAIPSAFPMAAVAQVLGPQFAGAVSSLSPAVLGLVGIPGDSTSAANQLISAISTLPDIPANIRLTGHNEENLLESRKATSLKLDGAIHYRPNDKIDISYAYRRGTGDGVYQGSERYALRDFIQQFHKFEVAGDEFFVRAYTSITDDGNSYNLTALGTFSELNFINSTNDATGTPAWVSAYLTGYAFNLLAPTQFMGTSSYEQEQVDQAHQFARAVANGGSDDIAAALVRTLLEYEYTRPTPGTDEYNEWIDSVRFANFNGDPDGAGFKDNSRMYHAEFNYNFKNVFTIFDLLVGGNWRQYDLFTNGTVFLEDPDGDGVNERIKINEYAGYIQIGKKLLDDRLKLQASARYDKNENFDGQISPRVSIVYSAGERRQHNVRASWQTGFRNPSTQDQYIFFPSSAGLLLGSVEDNAAIFGLHNGGAYTAASAEAARLAMDTSLLVQANIPYVQPEQLTAFEVGYKGLPHKKLLIDFNGYFNIYKDFIIEQTFALKEGVTVNGTYFQGIDNILRGEAGPAVESTFRPSFNAPVKIKSYGIGVGTSYKLPRNFRINASYNFDNFFFDEDEAPEGFSPQFNTPKHKWQASFNSTGIKRHENFGFDISYRWNAETFYESSFAVGTLPSYGVLNGQVSYKIPKAMSTVKLGGQNILRKEYRTNPGGPFIGSLWYVGWTFDTFDPTREKKERKRKSNDEG